MTKWQMQLVGDKPQLNNPILIEGLPGIGNVGKVIVDFMIDELKAKKLYDVTSYYFPHSVFVNEKNLVELPSIEIYYKKFGGKKRDLLLLTGDVQPMDEVSSYEFCDKIISLLESLNGREIITLGGIGLPEIPKKPKVYCTGNNKKIIEKYKTDAVNNNLYGVVGPIIGVTGLLLGLSSKKNMDAIAFLAETYAHPMYLGVKGAREIIKVLNEKLQMNIKIDKLKKEIEDIEEEMIKRTKDLEEVSKDTALRKLKGKLGGEVSYIG